MNPQRTLALLFSLAIALQCGGAQIQRKPAEPVKTKTVLLIHGMFFTPLAWENWVKYLESKGYKVIAPAWPGKDIPIEELRKKHPDKDLAKLSLTQIVEHYAAIISKLEEKPVLIGHSMGGLIVQLLLQRGLGERGVAIDSAPPKGVLVFKWSFFKSNWEVISPFKSVNDPIKLSLEQFQYAFVNTLPAAEQKAIYEKYAVPESRLVGKGPDSDEGKIDFKKDRPPLLIIAGEKDHIIPAGLNRKNYEKYSDSPAITDFKEFPGRDHFIAGEKGWEEVADYVIGWLTKK